MRFIYHDYYQNYKRKTELDHLGGNIYGDCNVVKGGDYYHNGNLLIPAGTIIQYITNNAPGGWLVCDGSEVKKTDYPRLYKVIGETFGVPDDSNNFVLPDLRGRVPLGSGHGDGLTQREIGDASGNETHTLTTDEIPGHTHNGTTDTSGEHTHSINDPGHNHNISSQIQISGNNTADGLDSTGDEIDNKSLVNRNTTTNVTGITINSEGSHNHTFTTNSTGGNETHNNMQPYLVLNYIIRY